MAGVRGKLTTIGELDGSITDRVRRIADTFTRAGLETLVSANIVGAMWDKLLVNVATGALCAITRLAYGRLYAVPEIEVCAIAAVGEAMAVAAAHGIRLSSVAPRDAWTLAAEGMPPEFKTSMLQSLEKGQPTEVDYVNGAVVRWGERCGVVTPVNRTLVACVKGIELALQRDARMGERDPTGATDTLTPQSKASREPAWPTPEQSYVEHVAVRVRDIHWHIRFFREALGMTIRAVDGDADNPKQVWTVGGVQLMADPGFAGPEGRLAHLGVMTEDLEAALPPPTPGMASMPCRRDATGCSCRMDCASR